MRSKTLMLLAVLPLAVGVCSPVAVVSVCAVSHVSTDLRLRAELSRDLGDQVALGWYVSDGHYRSGDRDVSAALVPTRPAPPGVTVYRRYELEGRSYADYPPWGPSEWDCDLDLHSCMPLSVREAFLSHTDPALEVWNQQRVWLCADD